MRGEQLDRRVDGQLQYVVDRVTVVAHFQNFVLEAFASAALAREFDVGHELHADLDDSFALTLFAAAAGYVEREMRCGQVVVTGVRLVGKQLADIVVCLDVGDRIRARRLADRVLIDDLDRLDLVQIAAEPLEAAGLASRVVQDTADGRVEDVAHER